jgi:hypothetical protein
MSTRSQLPVTLEGAIITGHGPTFALATVAPTVLRDPAEAERFVLLLEEQVFPGMPVALMAREWNGQVCFYGHVDVPKLLAGVPLSRVAWRRYPLPHG